MLLQTQPLATHFALSLTPSKPIINIQFTPPKPKSFQSPFRNVKCALSVISEPSHREFRSDKPFPAEVSRTIMELASVGTLSTLNQEGWPLGIGVRYAVDPEGTPVLCLNTSIRQSSMDRRSSLHVQLEQCGLKTPQCTIQGSLGKPEDKMVLKKLHSLWKNKFGEEADDDLMYVVCVERVLQIDDLKEAGVWVTSSDYRDAHPDPLRDFAEKLVNEINTNNIEDVIRFCNIYVDFDQVSEAKLIWVDRLGFDMRVFSQKGIFEVRIPFPREVTDVKGVKSTFNCMSQLAWEVEKNFHVPDFQKVKHLKQIL
ncbi:hypothetical protein F2P56_026953 [Juglans regia]|uniref:DUF2470 domain-containing protein n=2 Tax=Juglans regia TaxID=51240 RepID=A0A833U2P3_JUGRE|nr:glutamyl-tRNA reductase-binding protein, chloroplastic [Juglans regia]KAF5451894.1 hypothetical protein F2P56_026953 [Juglans regia]